MVKILHSSSFSLHFEKHKGSTGGLQRHNEREPGQRHSNKNIKGYKTKDNIFLIPKDDRTYRERIDDRLKEGYTGKKAIRKDAVDMVEVTFQLGGDITRLSEEKQVEAIKEAFEELKEMYGEENIISAVIHVDETTPHLHMDFVPLTPDGKLSAKSVIGDKAKMRKTQERFLERMQERCPHARFERLDPEKAQFNGLDQALYEKITAASRQLEADVLEREDALEDKEIDLELRQEAFEKHVETENKKLAEDRKWIEENKKAIEEAKQAIERDKHILTSNQKTFVDAVSQFADEKESFTYEKETFESERKAFEIEKHDFQEIARNVDGFVKQLEDEKVKLRDEKAKMDAREANISSRETRLANQEAFILEKDQKAVKELVEARAERLKAENEKREAQKLMQEANERIEVAQATESRVQKLLEELKEHGKRLVLDIKQTIGRWTSQVVQSRKPNAVEYFEERTHKLADDLEEKQEQENFVQLAREDLDFYNEDMHDALEI